MYHSEQIRIHKPADFAAMRRAGALASRVLDMLHPHVRAGTSTRQLDRLAYEFILKHGALPATLYYRGYSACLCTSVNHVVCHGIPNDRPLARGDMLNIDVTIVLDGWHGDHSRMFSVGTPPVKARRLMDACHRAMMAGIAAVKPNACFGDIGAAIQAEARRAGCTIVEEFCGHGIGQEFHAAPNVLHYGQPQTGARLMPGMFFTIEPMVNLGRRDVKILADGWTAVTRDRSLSAQYEHSVGVTEEGCEIFTRSPAGLDMPHTQPADAG